MIIMQMSGGLGNQMFQYALALQLTALGREVVWDDQTQYPEGIVGEETGSGVILRPKLLGEAFGITWQRVREEDMIRIKDADMRLVSRIRRKVRGRHSLEIRDEDFRFDQTFLERTEGYYTGCYQSERYFAGAREAVRDAFTFRENILDGDPAAQKLASDIMACPCPAAVHLRFGDYLTKADIYGGICTDAYYDAAIRYILDRNPDTVFYVFSNDAGKALEWIRRRSGMAQKATAKDEALQKRTAQDGGSWEETAPAGAGPRFVCVEGRDEPHGHIDLYLMHLCRHYVIANSSFSWWGAWLGRQRQYQSGAAPAQVLTMAPSMWIHLGDGSELRRTDIFTEEMVRISPAGKNVMSERPLVSVIVAAYNIEQYIARALDSLLAQTWPNLEIIVVDDGSTDATGGIIDRFGAANEKIRVIHKENGGLSDARNAGLGIARGEYIGYLDGDDWADPPMFEAMVTGCLISDAQMAMIGYRSVEDNLAQQDPARQGTQESRSIYAPENSGSVHEILSRGTLMSGRQALRAHILSGISEDLTPTPFYNSVWSKLYRADLVQGMRFPKGKNSEDIMYTSRALSRAGTCCYLPDALYNYVQNRAGSIMNRKLGERRVNDEMPFWKEQIALLKTHEDPYVAGDLADLAEFAYFRRLLYYENEMRQDPGMQEYADVMQELLMQDKPRAEELIHSGNLGRRGDRARLRLFLFSPPLFRAVTKIYMKFRT